MSIIVVDIETTGLDPLKHCIISIAAIDFENTQNIFYKECKIDEDTQVDPKASEITGYKIGHSSENNKQTVKQILQEFMQWLKPKDKWILAGQNPSFDRDFLNHFLKKHNLNYKIHHRTIDLHTVCINHIITSKNKQVKDLKNTLNSDTIATYVGLPKEPRPHIAINGALWETEAFYRLFYAKNKIQQFEKHLIPTHLISN